VLYNGAEKYHEKKLLKLSDAYKATGKNELELTVKVLNINKGHNTRIAERSKTLGDYVAFVSAIRENLEKGMTRERAILNGVKYCIANDIMRDFLEVHGGEVSNMLFTEFNMDDALEVAREEGIEAERARWQGVVADKDTTIADRDTTIADKNTTIADQATEIERLRARLAKQNGE
jgi:hypothetical protein